MVTANTAGNAGSSPGAVFGQDGTGGNATGAAGNAGGDGGGVHTTGPLTIRVSAIAGEHGRRRGLGCDGLCR